MNEMVSQNFEKALTPGRVPKNLRQQLEDLIEKLEEESEEE